MMLLLLLLLQPLPATPLLTAAHAEEAASISPQIHAALAKRPLDVEAIEALMRRVEEITDAYFHAPNLKASSIRSAALALRPIVNGWISGPTPILALAHDALRFRPEVHRALAEAYRAQGRWGDARRHLAEALAVVETRTDLEAWDAVEAKLGRVSRRAAGYIPRP